MMMANKLPPTVRAYMSGSNISKRYIRVDELAEAYKIETSDAEQIAIAADRCIGSHGLHSYIKRGLMIL
jgi:hypothetical protein